MTDRIQIFAKYGPPEPATGGVDATPPGQSTARRSHHPFEVCCTTIAILHDEINELRAENTVLRDENQLLLAKCDVAQASADTWRATYEGHRR